MATYQERVNKVTEILQEAGAILYKINKISGYGVFTDSLHSTIINDPEGDWGEYPVAHAVFKFGRLDNPRYFYTKARISKNAAKEKIDFGFVLSHPKISSGFPKLGELEEKTEKYFGYSGGYTNAVTVASRINNTIEKHKKLKRIKEIEGGVVVEWD